MVPVVTQLDGKPVATRVTRMSRKARRMGAVGVLGAVLLAGSACTGPQQTPVAGAAALVGGYRIADAQLAEQVGELMTAGQRSAGTKDPFTPQIVLQNDIIIHLMDVLAAEQGVRVTQGEIDAQVLQYEQDVQGRAALEEVFVKMSVPPSQIEPWVRANLLGKKLSLALAPDQPIEQGQAALQAALADVSARQGTQISPRYGAWDAKTISIVEAPNRLSTPLNP